MPWVTNADVVAMIPWLIVAGAAVSPCSPGSSGMRRFLDV